MAREINLHVERLSRYQPFSANAADLVSEQAEVTERGYLTNAYEYVLSALDDTNVQLVVLTGDAGHGKTYLCAQVLQACGHDAKSALEAIRTRARGAETICTSPHLGRPVEIVKDLSEFTIEEGADLLQAFLYNERDGIAIVCANEGRLRRAVQSSIDDKVQQLISTLNSGIRDGRCASADSRVTIVNLNYQSVVRDDRKGVVDWAITRWAVDQRRWRRCGDCDNKDSCPIYKNHTLLADPSKGHNRREAVKQILATAERTGTVLTIRQALATVAYAITGGIRCADVHRIHSSFHDQNVWQHQYLFHQALFGDRLSSRQRKDVPAFSALRKLDPGASAVRAVDDVLDPLDSDDAFLPPMISTDGATPRSKRDAQRESDAVRRLFSHLRRQSFFDEPDVNSLFSRMGLRAGADFQAAATGTLAGAHNTSTRDTLIRGLEAVQGVRRSGSRTELLVLDPAFANHRNRAAVVGAKIAGRSIIVRGQIDHWKLTNPEPALPSAVDWLSRTAIVHVGSAVAIPLDLFRFELLYRWASGLSARTEHAASIRQINGLLASIVPEAGEDDEIVVLVGSERRTLSIDLDERVRSGDS